MLPKAFLISCALAFMGAQAAIIQRAPDCDANKMWPIQSIRPKDDVILADRFVGLSPPVKATLLMIFELQPRFLYGGAVTDKVNECMLRSNSQSMRIYQWATFIDICSIRFPFSLQVEAFKQPIGDTSFGILPLIADAAFKTLHYMPESLTEWSNGYNPEDIAQDIQIFFSRITPVPLSIRLVSEIIATKDSDLEKILDSAPESPVFLVTRYSVNILRLKGTDGWQGYDINKTWKTLTFTADQIRNSANEMLLIYNIAQVPFPAEGIPHPVPCTERRFSNSTD